MRERRTILIAVDVETESDDRDLSEAVKARLSEFYPDGDGGFLQPSRVTVAVSSWRA